MSGNYELRQKSKDENGEFETLEVTGFDYFVNYYKIDLRYSVCSLVSLQRYTKALNTMQRASLVEKSRQKPQERMRVLTDLKVGYSCMCTPYFGENLEDHAQVNDVLAEMGTYFQMQVNIMIDDYLDCFGAPDS
ncbi:hypothetical protein LXL04_008230 [Taraxacum kok-saghyz]